MRSIDLNTKELKKFGINSHDEGFFIIVLGAPWVKSCKLLSSLITKLRTKNLIMFKEIDIGEYIEITKEFNIYTMPALIFFKDGTLLDEDREFNEEILFKNGGLIGSVKESILKGLTGQI